MLAHELYIQRCLKLAQLGAGSVAPNPMVGAVLVHNNSIIGEGYHQQFGGPHAEVNCINSVQDKNKSLIVNSSLYVSLEPCAHVGLTPPCTDLIIKNKIPFVFIGCRDINTNVVGMGIEKLKAAGIQVVAGILEKESKEINKRFFTFHLQHRPYIILKWAQSSDKKIAGPPGKRVFISHELSNRMVHKWRSEEAAIMIGTNTALADDPALSVRLWPGNNPIRIIIDTDLKLPLTLQVFDKSIKTIVFNTVKHLDTGNLLFYKIDPEHPAIPQILSALYQLQVQSVIIEGGARLLQSFIDEGLWDEARVISNDQLVIGEGLPAPVLGPNSIKETMQFETDTINFHIPIF